MNKEKAKKWLADPDHRMTVKQALSLIKKTPPKGKSKSDARLSKERVLETMRKAVEDIGKKKGLDYDLCENTSMNRLLVKHIIMECLP